MLREGRVDQFFNDAIGHLNQGGFTETKRTSPGQIDDTNDFRCAPTVVYPALKPMMVDIEAVEKDLECPEFLVGTFASA